MAEVIAQDFSKVEKGYANQLVIKRFKYDVAQDGGASADTVTLGQFQDDMVILQGYTKITKDFASGGDATLEIGVGADDDALLTSTAVASAKAGVAPGAAASVGLLAKAGDKIVATIGTADMTAGALEVVLVCLVP